MFKYDRKRSNKLSCNFIVALFSLFFVLFSIAPAFAGVEGFPIFIAGPATINGQDVSDGDIVSLEVDGVELASCEVGSIQNLPSGWRYSLQVPTWDNQGDSSDTSPFPVGEKDNEALIFINGFPVDQNPVILGPPRSQTELAINATTAVQEIPDVSHMGEEDARTELGNAGFANISTIEECNSEEPAGGVISQDPVAGTMVAPGSTVTLVVSTGPCPREIPNVTGMSQGAAESAITNAGFTVGSLTEECSDTVAAGNVISQDPSGGTGADFGTSVNLVVSTGPCQVAVPSALNCADITNAGLVCNLVEQCDNNVAVGGVISQDPVAGTMVAPGSTVTLVVSTGPCPREIPNVTGMSQGAAESAITNAGFTVGSVTEECSDTVAAGNVISQDPSGGTGADFGTSVNLVVSTGPCQVAVPSALNCADITNAGLVCNLVEQCDNNVAVGGVISQDPVAGTMVAPGSTVTLVVSTGPCPREIPNVTGMSQGAAESAITNAGFTVGSLTEECSDTVAAGNVISQDPVAGTMVAPGSTVTLVVSTGPCPREIPNVTGMSQGAAESAITNAGFTVGSVTEECSDTVAAGNVISQDPSGGTGADFGTSVNLVVSTGPCQVAVPSALNCADITNAGLVCNLIEQCDNNVAVGGVISQDPVAGTMVAPGSTVTLVISTGPCNEEPVAVDDEYSIDEDNILTMPATGVLDNDIDADDDSLTAVLVSEPSNGTLTLNADGSFEYTPNENFYGDDSFTYVANDGVEDSDTATVTITINPVNDPPVADAGTDQANVSLGDVPLDGSGSTDEDEDQITFNWTIISEPYVGAGQLDDVNLVNPTLIIDGYGSYEVQLEVCDDDACDSDTVQIATEGNLKPVANAGEDKTVGQYDDVCLDGSGSDPNDDEISFNWEITAPDGTEVLPDDSTSPQPCFMADQIGDYTATLVVSDGYLDSDSDTVTISVEGNSRPVADAGEDRNVTVGQEVCLDGSESSDPDGDDITYSWAITSRPVGSDATAAYLDDPGKGNPCFTPDVPGTYVVQLTVTDEHGLSGDPVTVTITGTEGEEPVQGDLNEDGIVDMADLNIILAARNTPADGPDDPRDLDRDKMITALDARNLVLLCTCPRCMCP